MGVTRFATIVPAGVQLGLGVKTASVYRISSQGSLLSTDNTLDVAVQGKGYFQVTLPNGQTGQPYPGASLTATSGTPPYSFSIASGSLPPTVMLETTGAIHSIDGTTLTAKGMSNAVSVLAVAPRGSMYDPSAVFYMEKLVTGPEAADAVDITAPVGANLKWVAKAKGERVEDLTVVILDRPRHEDIVRQVRAAGARTIVEDEPDRGAVGRVGASAIPDEVFAALAAQRLDGLLAQDEAEARARAQGGEGAGATSR